MRGSVAYGSVVARLPRFATAEAVPPEWELYLSRVYGCDRLTELSFPIDLREFDVLYETLLPAKFRRLVDGRPLLGLSSSNASLLRPGDPLERVSTSRGGLTRRRSTETRLSGRQQHDIYSMWPASALAFVYQWSSAPSLARLQSGYPNHTLAEVAHCGEDREDGFFWMYGAVGSGVYFDVGRTIVARDIVQLWHRFNISSSYMIKHHWQRKVCRTTSYVNRVNVRCGSHNHLSCSHAAHALCCAHSAHSRARSFTARTRRSRCTRSTA